MYSVRVCEAPRNLDIEILQTILADKRRMGRLLDSIKLELLIPQGRQRDTMGVIKAAAEDFVPTVRYAYLSHFPDLRDIALAIMRSVAEKISAQVL